MKLSIGQIIEATGGMLDVSTPEDRADDPPDLFAQYRRTEDASGKPANTGNAAETPIDIVGFSWDSRAIQPGWLYVALPGERVDGHEYAAAAVKAGAKAVLATRRVPVNVPVILVDDAARALSDLARYWRGIMRGAVVGLTGSSGKTTTKNLVRDVLASA